ncbi:hypothetical protein CR513_32820, partial [Mucuna pruriens]
MVWFGSVRSRWKRTMRLPLGICIAQDTNSEPTRMDFNCFIINAIRNKCIVISVRALPVDENTIWHAKIFSVIKVLPQILHSKAEPKRGVSINSSSTNRMIAGVPISNKNDNVPMWGIKRNRNDGSVVDNETPKSTSSSLKMKGREVEKASNLILHLELVSPVPLRRNGTVGAKNTILPRTPPLLNPRPVSTNHTPKFHKFSSVKQIQVQI